MNINSDNNCQSLDDERDEWMEWSKYFSKLRFWEYGYLFSSLLPNQLFIHWVFRSDIIIIQKWIVIYFLVQLEEDGFYINHPNIVLNNDDIIHMFSLEEILLIEQKISNVPTWVKYYRKLLWLLVRWM